MATSARPHPAATVFLLCFSVLWAFRSRAWLLPFHGDSVAFDLPYARALAAGSLAWHPDSASAILWHPPLYPLAVAFLGRVTGWNAFALGMAGFAAAAALAAAAFAIARRRLPLGWSALAALAVIASPALLGEAARVQGEIPAAALFLWALHLAWEGRRGAAAGLLTAAVLVSTRAVYAAPLVAWAAASAAGRAAVPRTLATVLGAPFAAAGAWIAFVLVSGASDTGFRVGIPPVESLGVPSQGGLGPLAHVALQLVAEDGRWVPALFFLSWVLVRFARSRNFAHVGGLERVLLAVCAVDVFTAAGAGDFRLREIALSSALLQILGAFGIRGILEQIRERSPAGTATSPLVASASFVSVLGLALLPAKGVLSWEGPPTRHADLGARRASEGLPRLVASWWAELEARRADKPLPEIVSHAPVTVWLADPAWGYVSEAPSILPVEEETERRAGDRLYVFAWDEWGASRPGKSWIEERKLRLGLTACAQVAREGWTLEVCEPGNGAERSAGPSSAPPGSVTSPREARPRTPTSNLAE